MEEALEFRYLSCRVALLQGFSGDQPHSLPFSTSSDATTQNGGKAALLALQIHTRAALQVSYAKLCFPAISSYFVY